VIWGVELWTLMAIGVAVFAGAVVQGAVGLGLGLVGAPVVALLEPHLLPGVMLWLAAVYPLLTLWGEWGDADWRGLRWALLARVPGTALGVAVVAEVSTRVLAIAVAVVVLLAVALTVWTVRIPINRGTLLTAGIVSGVAGTATSIGGPPLALLYQRRSGPQVRATLAAYFVAGAALSLLALGLAGQDSAVDLGVACVLVPCLLAGFAAARPLRRHVDAGRTQVAVLAVCAASASVLLVRSLFG
jgi:uncharacterized membrane protein YfcA